MTSTPPGHTTPDPVAGIRQLERFLAVESERTRARQAAEAFADRMPHLTTSERRQLVLLYTREQLGASRNLRAQLARQRTAYETRDLLRRRCVAVAVLLSTACAGYTIFTLRALTAS